VGVTESHPPALLAAAAKLRGIPVLLTEIDCAAGFAPPAWAVNFSAEASTSSDGGVETVRLTEITWLFAALGELTVTVPL
jgi:hypothetical protein